MIFEYKKWGKGSSFYSAYVATYYDVLTERFDFKYIGVINKVGSKWVGKYEAIEIEGTTRKEVSEKLANLIN